jgi:hypothetical protein
MQMREFGNHSIAKQKKRIKLCSDLFIDFFLESFLLFKALKISLFKVN